jgi:hypothetical protein
MEDKDIIKVELQYIQILQWVEVEEVVLELLDKIITLQELIQQVQMVVMDLQVQLVDHQLQELVEVVQEITQDHQPLWQVAMVELVEEEMEKVVLNHQNLEVQEHLIQVVVEVEAEMDLQVQVLMVQQVVQEW